MYTSCRNCNKVMKSKVAEKEFCSRDDCVKERSLIKQIEKLLNTKKCRNCLKEFDGDIPEEQFCKRKICIYERKKDKEYTDNRDEFIREMVKRQMISISE